jgi:hypothetical protein
MVLADSLRTDGHLFRQLATQPANVIELREWSRMHDELQGDRNAIVDAGVAHHQDPDGPSHPANRRRREPAAAAQHTGVLCSGHRRRSHRALRPARRTRPPDRRTAQDLQARLESLLDAPPRSRSRGGARAERGHDHPDHARDRRDRGGDAARGSDGATPRARLPRLASACRRGPGHTTLRQEDGRELRLDPAGRFEARPAPTITRSRSTHEPRPLRGGPRQLLGGPSLTGSRRAWTGAAYRRPCRHPSQRPRPRHRRLRRAHASRRGSLGRSQPAA